MEGERVSDLEAILLAVLCVCGMALVLWIIGAGIQGRTQLRMHQEIIRAQHAALTRAARPTPARRDR